MLFNVYDLLVDNAAVEKLLERWIKTAEQARGVEHNSWGGSSLSDWADRNSPHLIALREREPQVQRVLQHVLKLDELPTILSGSGDSVYVIGGIEQCRYALGHLRTDAETRAILGPSAPTMAADSLHPEIWLMASGLWEGGHYRVAVQKAVTHLNGCIQDRTSRYDISDKELMQQVFSTAPPQLGKPRLWWPGDQNDRSVRSMRDGILNFSQGIFAAIRNITTHSTDELPRQQAFEMLTAVSLLSHWLDGCELVEARGIELD